MNAPQKILVPTDFSQYADKALEEALLLARQFKAEVHLLHVVDDIQQCAIDYCLSQELVDEYRKSSTQASQEKLQKMIEKIPDAKELKVLANVRIGTPFEEILKEEQDQKIDLIVIASHGRTGFLQHLMGSVAERVSRRAKSRVMLVKP